MKKLMPIIKYCLLFVALILIYNAALYMISLIDSSKLRNNVEKSYQIMKEEGYRHIIVKPFDIANDTYTDALIINECYSIDHKDPYISYMKARRNYNKDLTVAEVNEVNGEGITINYDYEREEEFIFSESISELGAFLDGKIHHTISYGRYWHGYLVFLRPLLLFLDINGIRYVLLSLLILLFIYFIYLIYKEFGKNIALIFGLSLICCGCLTTYYSLSDAQPFLIMMVSSIILLKRINKLKSFNMYIFIVGSVTNFIDYLRTPLITLAIPCIIYLLKLFKDKQDWKYCVKFIIKSSIMWLIGYSLTWITKWNLYNLTIGDNNDMLAIAFKQVLYRMSRKNEVWDPDANYFVIIFNMLKRVLIHIGASSIIVLVVNKFKFSFKYNQNIIPLLVLSLYPIIWYIALANHTILHDFFIYRILVIFMLCIMLSLYQLFNLPEKKKKRKARI